MNINEFKQLLKKNSYVDVASRIVCFPMFAFDEFKSDAASKKRANGYKDSRYIWMKKYKNAAKKRRCFIVATGPSLTMEDLELIQSEYSFGMNSVIKAFDKTNWRPSFYMIQDEYVYDKLESDLKSYIDSHAFPIAVGGIISQRYESAKECLPYELNYLDHKMYHRKGFGKFKFSEDSYNVIYDAYTVNFSVLQMAVYMGFKEIYLLGCDCNYNLPKSHFVDYGHTDPKAAIMGNKMIAGHYEFKKFADSVGVKVINCTRGGMLEAYPRMMLEDVLREKENI